MMDSERRGEEESAPDSQDLSSAASLDRGNDFTMCDFLFSSRLYWFLMDKNLYFRFRLKQ